MSKTPNMQNPGFDGSSEPHPLRRKELLEMQRWMGSRNPLLNPDNSRERGNKFKSPDMRIPSIVITQSELRLERPKELLVRMERSRSASKISPKRRFGTWEKPKTPEMRGEPLRPKDFLEQQFRHRYGSAAKLPQSTPVSSQDREELLKTPEISKPSAVTSHSEMRLERPKELLKRLENSKCRSASASKVPSKNNFLTPESRQEPRTPDMRCPCSVEPSWEARPLRTKELLERQRQATITCRSASASKIGPDRTKAAASASSFTSSRLLVPSIGFSYPKDPRTCPTSTSSKKPPSKLTNTKRNLFHQEMQKEALRQKLERITGQWRGMTEHQLRQLILDFVNLCLPSSGAKCSHLSRDCYVNQLMEALQQLQYPKEVNKTWLRMPNSQQAIGHWLEILHFLLDFVEDDREENGGICLFPIVPDGKPIFQQAARAFRSSTEASCTSYAISLQQELENLKLQPESADLCSELNSLQEEKQRLQEELASCQAEIKTSASESTENVKKLGHLYMTNLSQGQLLAKLKDRVRQQTCSLQDYGKMLDQQEELTQELQLYRLRLQEFAERLRLGKLKLKRCQREQQESIEAFNVQIRDYEYSLASKSSNPISLQLSTNATLPQIEEIIERLRGKAAFLEASPVNHISSSTSRHPLGAVSHEGLSPH